MGKLIYRELYLARKYYIICYLVFAVIFTLEVLVRVSMVHGNMANMDAIDFKDVDEVTYYLFTYFIPIAFFLVIDDSSVILSDVKSKWYLFSYTTPISEYRLVGLKYIIKVSMFVISLLMVIGNAAVIGSLCGIPLNMEVTQNLLLIAGVMSFLIFIRTPMLINCKTDGAVTKMKTILGFGVVVCMFLVEFKAMDMLKNLRETHPDLDDIDFGNLMADEVWAMVARVRESLSAFLPFIIIAVIAISYFATVWQMKRRDK